MNITKEDVDALNAVLKIQIAPEDYETTVVDVLKEQRKNVQMPGFRSGKVPFGMIKKMYGKAVLADEINKLLSKTINSYITENSLEVLGNPLPQDDNNPKELDLGLAFEFSYDLGLAPQFDVNLSEKDKFDYFRIAVDEPLIDKYVNDLAKRYGKVGQAEVSNDIDLVQGDFIELDESGEIKEGGIMHTSTISLEYVEDEDSRKSLVGLKVEDTVVLDPDKISRGVADKAAMLGIEKDQAETLTSNFRFRVKNINTMAPADLDQELFDKVFGPGTVDSVEGFRSKVSEQLAQMLEQDADRKLRRDVSDALIEKLKLELPNEFLKRWLMASSEGKFTAEQLESDYENYAKGLKWQLIENKIIKENDVKVEPEDALSRAKELLARQLMQYGQTDFDDEALSNAAQQLLTKEEDAKNIYTQLFDEKILSLFKERLKLKDKEVGFDEFVKLATGKPAKKGLLDNLNNLIKF